MADDNVLALRTLASTMEELDIRYMEAEVADKLAMKDELDEAGVAEGRYELLRDWHIPKFKIVQ